MTQNSDRAKANAVFSKIAIKGLEEAVRAYDRAYDDLHKFADYEKKGRAEWNTIMNLAVQREVNKEKVLLQDGIVPGQYGLLKPKTNIAQLVSTR